MSSGNGGGKGFFDNWVNVDSLSGGGNFFENLGNDLLNFGVQAGTGGWLSYEDGKIGNGVTTNAFKSTGQATVSGLKTVTGAKAAEAANEVARKQFEESKAASEKDRVETIAQNARDQVRQSQMAGAARATAASRITAKGSSATSGGGSLSLGDDEKDFLGI